MLMFRAQGSTDLVGRKVAAVLEEAGDTGGAGIASYCVALNYFGMGLIDRSLEAAARAESLGKLTEDSLNAALATFQALGAEFEIARTRLPLAELAHLSGDGEASGAHLIQAAAFFETAQASSYTARVAELATRIGVNLAAGGRA